MSRDDDEEQFGHFTMLIGDATKSFAVFSGDHIESSSKSSEPFDIGMDESTEDSDEDILQCLLNSTYQIDYEVCQACRKRIIIDEQGGYVPSLKQYLCYPYVRGSCQQQLKMVANIEKDFEKSNVMREMGCYSKPTKRWFGVVWCGNVVVYSIK